MSRKREASGRVKRLYQWSCYISQVTPAGSSNDRMQSETERNTMVLEHIPTIDRTIRLHVKLIDPWTNAAGLRKR